MTNKEIANFTLNYKTLRDELRTFRKEDIINFLVVKELLEKDNKVELWWAVDKDGTKHLFTEAPYRNEEKWFPQEKSYSIGDLNTFIESRYGEIDWEDEPLNITVSI